MANSLLFEESTHRIMRLMNGRYEIVIYMISNNIALAILLFLKFYPMDFIYREFLNLLRN
jgi:hypothetical protein